MANKFCEDCKHYEPYVVEGASEKAKREFSRCDAVPSSDPLQFVSRSFQGKMYCQVMRGISGQCAPEGKLFEKRRARSGDSADGESESQL